jgi:hypothetical protein
MTAPCFHSDLKVKKVGRYTWELLEDLVFESKMLRGFLVLPKGSVIDFASTPRLIWWLLPKNGQYDWGTALHDGGYKGLLRTRSGQRIRLTRELSDLLMDEGNEAVGVSGSERKVLLFGVRAFGGKAYKGVPHA